MGVRSTYAITTATARQVLLSNILSLSNEELASMLYELPQCQYMNFDVVDIASEYTYGAVIESVEQFNRLAGHTS